MHTSSNVRFGGGRVPGLDVARAMAIVLVLANHWAAHFGLWFGYPTISPLWDFAGDTGVELFFALSGFLIGRILLDMRPDWRNFRIFLIRRALRTLPLYFVWLALLLLVFPPVGDVAAIGLRYATLTQNLIAPLPANYYFAVTWSLAVEEWFYLLSGGAIVLFSVAFGGRRAIWLYLALFLLVPVAARPLCENWRGLVPFRLDEIAYGVLLALLYRANSRLFAHPWLALAIGLALIAFAAQGLPPLPAAWAQYAVGEATVIGGALCLPAALLTRHLPAWFAGPVHWIGTRSYALYIIHLTVLVDVVEARLLSAGWLPLPLCAAVAVVLPCALAELSFRFLETPVLRLRPRHEAAPAATETGPPAMPTGAMPAPG